MYLFWLSKIFTRANQNISALDLWLPAIHSGASSPSLIPIFHKTAIHSLGNLIPTMLFIPGGPRAWLRANRTFLAGLALVPYPILPGLYSLPEPSSQIPDLPEPSQITVPAETFSLNFAWDSRYVREGRTVLEDVGIPSIAIDRSMPLEVGGEWYFSSWYAESLEVDFAELNLALGYGFSIEEVDFAVGYAWSTFQGHAHEEFILAGHEHEFAENEIELEVEFRLLDKVDISSAFIYSPAVGGTFIELVASTDIVKEKWVFTPYLLLGLNRGFIPEEPETFNNLQFGLTATTELFDGVEAAFYLATSTGLEDIFWTGVSVSLGESFLLHRQ